LPELSIKATGQDASVLSGVAAIRKEGVLKLSMEIGSVSILLGKGTLPKA